MKKSLLLLGLFTASLTQAQNCAEGFFSDAIYDDFNSATELGDSLGGIYWWGQDDLAGDDAPNFQATMTRNTTSGELDVTVSQGQGEYEPLGISFGTVGEGGRLTTIDLSSDATMEITITNNSSYNLYFQIAIEDTLGKIISIGSTATDYSTFYLHTIQVLINAGQTKTFSADFEGGYSANANTSQLEQNLDYTIVTGVSITVVNQASTGDPDWEPLVISDADFSIDAFRLGPCKSSTGVRSVVNASNEFALFPNPTEGQLNIQNASLDLAGNYTAMIYDVRGALVQTALLSSNALDVSMLESGLYHIQVIGADQNFNAGSFIVK